MRESRGSPEPRVKRTQLQMKINKRCYCSFYCNFVFLFLFGVFLSVLYIFISVCLLWALLLADDLIKEVYCYLPFMIIFQTNSMLRNSEFHRV